MTVMESGSEILKVDEVGRVRTPPEKREAMLAEYERSGMTGAQFARFVGVRYSTLMYWLQKRRKGAGQGEQAAMHARKERPRWLEARVEGEVAQSEKMVVEMGGGVRMLVSNRTQAGASGRSSPGDRVGPGMLSVSGSLRVFVAVEACDMRKGFEGLSALVGTVLKEEVKSGALFALSNRRRTRLKILYWDGSGLWVLSKRLERGPSPGPSRERGGGKLPLRAEALSMLMDGIDLRGARMRSWYERE